MESHGSGELVLAVFAANKNRTCGLGGALGKVEDDVRVLGVKGLLTSPEMEMDDGRKCNSGEQFLQPWGTGERGKRGKWRRPRGLYVGRLGRLLLPLITRNKEEINTSVFGAVEFRR